MRAGQAVMLYGPSRYGKTSLARVVGSKVREEYEIPSIYVDLWGASGISDIVAILGQAYARVSGIFRMRRFLADLLGRLGFTVNFEGTSISVGYEGAQRERRERGVLMRNALQDSPDVSFLFVGSKQSLMDGLFSDRRRPFYNFGRRIELGRLPYEELGEFIEQQFEGAGRAITTEAADVLLELGQESPRKRCTPDLTSKRPAADRQGPPTRCSPGGYESV